MQHGDLKKFVITHQHTEARNHFPQNRGPLTGPLKLTEPSKLTEPHYMLCGTPVEKH